jgi:hypothetical protein
VETAVIAYVIFLVFVLAVVAAAVETWKDNT